MDTVLSILVFLLTAVGVLLALVLVAPLQVAAAASLDADHGAFDARVRWAFGLLGLDFKAGHGGVLRVLGVPVRRLRRGDRTPDKPTKPRKPRRPRKPGRRRGPTWAWRHRRTLWAAALRLLRTLHLRGQVAGVVGLPEPDDTAWVAIALDQLAGILPAGAVDVEPDYTDEVLDLEGRLGGWLIPGHALVVGLALLLNKNVRRALRAQ